MKDLEHESVREIQKDEKARKQMELITSIPGISAFVALLALHWFQYDQGITASSWVAYAGLDVSVRESGTWRGISRLTKRGNAFLRKRLYSAAWGAWQNDPYFKRYYEVLREENRSHVEALSIIARKLVRIMFSVLKTERAYDAQLCFPQEILAISL